MGRTRRLPARQAVPRDIPLVRSGRVPAGARFARRRRCLAVLAGLLLLHSLPAAIAAGSAAAQRPLSRSQQALLTDLLSAINRLQLAYVRAGLGLDEGSAAARRARQEQIRRQAAGLFRRFRQELGRRLDRQALERLEARWQTVADAGSTAPSLDIASLMIPMAAEVSAPLLAMLPAPSRDTPPALLRARRLMQLQQLQLQGAAACWQHKLVDWPLMDRRRRQLEQELKQMPLQGTRGVRLVAQWNLFASALPLRDAQCLPGAPQTLFDAGDNLAGLL